MRKLLITVLFLINLINVITIKAQNMGINEDGSEPNANAILDIKSTSKGVLIPRLNTSQRTTLGGTLSASEKGMMVFDSDLGSFYFWNSTSWEAIGGNIPTEIKDEDGNTKIQVEEGSDDNIIRFDLDGVEQMVLKKGSGWSRLEFPSNNNSIYMGTNAGLNNTSGYDNVMIGRDAGKFGNGKRSVGVGYDAGESNDGILNTFVGDEAGKKNTTANFNTMVGGNAGLLTTTGGDNTFVGQGSGILNVSGGGNTFVGRESGYNNNSGHSNVFIGREAGYSNTSGQNSVFIGFNAGRNETASNRLYIENSSSSAPLIYGEFDNNLVKINGTLNINNTYNLPTTDGSGGQFLATDGSGNVNWVNYSPAETSILDDKYESIISDLKSKIDLLEKKITSQNKQINELKSLKEQISEIKVQMGISNN